MPIHLILFGVFFLTCTSSLTAKNQLTVEGSGSEIRARVKVANPRNGGISVLELLDAKTGECIRTVHIGPLTGEVTSFLVSGHDAKSRHYRLRYREGIRLLLDGELKLPKDEKWINPCDMAVVGGFVYVLDSGRTVRKVAGKGNSVAAGDIVQLGKTCVYRFKQGGAFDTSYADEGKLVLRNQPSGIRAMTVDEQGWVYVPLAGHYIKIDETTDNEFVNYTVVGGYNAESGWVQVGTNTEEHPYVEAWNPSSKQVDHTIGGYSEEECTNHFTLQGRNTQSVNSVALGAGPRIYLYSQGYPTLRVYDRTKSGLDAFLYNIPEHAPLDGSLPRTLTSDRKGAIYFATSPGEILKLQDTGNDIKECYSSGPTEWLTHPTGLTASGGLVWAAANGPGFPYWDSGGGGEIALFWDTGHELRLVERYGKVGVAPNKLEFMNPSAVLQTPDHLQVWVAEDGMLNLEGPHGNARVRKFRMEADHSEEVEITLGRQQAGAKEGK